MDKPIKKRFFAKHAKSSAALVSLVIHAVLVIVAFTYVAVKVIEKPEQKFEDKRVARPKMELKKLQVPVKLDKKPNQQPKLRKTIVSKPKTKSLDIHMPEISGVKGGTGYLNEVGGLGEIGFDLDFNLFGKNKGSGNELEGTFFDLKMKPDGSPAKMDKNYYNEVIKQFINSWKLGVFERYFQAPKKKFATAFMVPKISAKEAPKAFAVDDVVQPRQWVAYYSGKIAAPANGRYRFWGIADDVLMVRIRRDLVLDGSLRNSISTWNSKDENSRKYKMSGAGLAIGDWFELRQGQPTDIEVLIGERPGGSFFCHLLVEQAGVEYPKGADGRPILPIFKLAEIPDRLIAKMKIDPGACTIDGPSFGVLKQGIANK